MLQFVGNFLEPSKAQKVREISGQWSDAKIYENIFPNKSEVAVFKHVNTEEMMWETIKFTKSWKPMPEQKELVSLLYRNDSAKWNAVFVWLVENRYELKKNTQNDAFLKKLMLAISENVTEKFTHQVTRYSPMMLAAAIDGIDSILTLIKRGEDVNQTDNSGWTALHFAAMYGSLNACDTLLENNANIDAADNIFGRTSLMRAAIYGKKKMYAFLIKKGANKNLFDSEHKTALELANFKEK